MHTFWIFLFFALVYIKGYTMAEPPVYSCEKHEESICGPTCIETCDYKPEFCTKDCRFGCFCKEGYVRQTNDTNSPCIKREKCGQKEEEAEHKCCKNQEYQSCGSACPPTCADFSFPLPKPEKMCITLCKSGCFCKDGYYRLGKKCVQPERCYRGENEEFQTCGTACPATCEYQPTGCTKQCIRGCFCKQGYIRQNNNTNSPCILKNEC